jgi:phage-related protein
LKLFVDFDSDPYRSICAVRFETGVYVLHCFKKKSKQGIKTPQSDIDLIKRRFRDAEADYAARRRSKENDL